MLLPAMLPRTADLHDSRGLPASEMDGSTDIVDWAASRGTALTSAAEAPSGWRWSFSASPPTRRRRAGEERRGRKVRFSLSSGGGAPRVWVWTVGVVGRPSTMEINRGENRCQVRNSVATIRNNLQRLQMRLVARDGPTGDRPLELPTGQLRYHGAVCTATRCQLITGSTRRRR